MSKITHLMDRNMEVKTKFQFLKDIKFRMGGDRRREFESHYRILDGHIFTLICCKLVLMFV